MKHILLNSIIFSLCASPLAHGASGATTASAASSPEHLETPPHSPPPLNPILIEFIKDNDLQAARWLLESGIRLTRKQINELKKTHHNSLVELNILRPELPFWREELPPTKSTDISLLAEMIQKKPVAYITTLTDDQIKTIHKNYTQFIKAYDALSRKTTMPLSKHNALNDRFQSLLIKNDLLPAILRDGDTQAIQKIIHNTRRIGRKIPFTIDEAFVKATDNSLSKAILKIYQIHPTIGKTITISPAILALVLLKKNAVSAFLQEYKNAYQNLIGHLLWYKNRISEKSFDIVMWLLKCGLDPNYNSFQGPLLVRFASANKPTIVRALLHAGADPNLRGEETGGTTPQAPSFLEELNTFSPEVQQEWTQFLAYKKERKAKIREALEPHRQQLPTTAAVPQEEVPGAGAAQTIPKEVVEIISEY